jgi:hypothetical protein
LFDAIAAQDRKRLCNAEKAFCREALSLACRLNELHSSRRCYAYQIFLERIRVTPAQDAITVVGA